MVFHAPGNPRRFAGLSLAAAVAALTVAAAFAQTIQGVDPGAGPVASTLIVSGIVEVSTPGEDKKVPPDIRLALDCHGDMSDGGGVSQGGQFRFRLTPDPGAIAAYNVCSMEAKLFGWESTVVKFPVRSTSGMVDVGVITIQRNDTGASETANRPRTGNTVSATSLKAPPEAVRLFDQGTRSLEKTKFADATKAFTAAIAIYPAYAEAWLNLGRARVSLDSLDSAREAFVHAAELDPQIAGPSAELGLLAVRQNDLPAAARYLDESLRLDPVGTYQTCYSDALVNFVLKRYDAAERSARAALRFGETPAQARADFILGMALLTRGSNAEAKQRLLKYLELSPKAPERDQVMKELSRLDHLANK